ncbi:MAG TPA: ATP-binding protein [Actinomycetota bacterium]|nr:ATP-binding protein [Actinomycetota bacterium]
MSSLTAAVTVEVPATPEFVQVLRHVAAGLAARVDMPIDLIEEVRLAVTEASSILLDQAEASALRMRIRRDDDSIEVTLSSDATVEPWPTEHALASWPWLVVKGLTDELRAEPGNDGQATIGFRKQRERVAR